MNDEKILKHFGILGMRWGVRRGRGNQSNTKAPKRASSEDHIRKKELKKKKLHELSNSELRSFNDRMQLERQYKDLKKSDVSSGSKFARELLRDLGKDLIKGYLKTTITEKIGKR